ncbi:DUF4179 domain-containing protein [Neobacillus sp. DY30]|uniref:DUF4179 domain-containing protein n=1 Tax=Neobacillus sp. DY30 TaxID=3047871 RepID=UPI0024C003CD|nr:DUF4179 domain-containing protein [Neobacillus sp. DY30]WHY00237.1 DUF4179 domain-containing protein [Neobacillus sp. DY30]
MDKERLIKHLDKAIEQQVPDVWDEIQKKIHRVDDLEYQEPFIKSKVHLQNKKRILTKRFSMVAAVCLITLSTLTFTPALAAIQELYDKIFSSEHIDDSGLKAAIDLGIGQFINQTYYDKENDISVHFQNVITDDQETKLLLTYQSKENNLENYYLDIFEGDSSVHLINDKGEKKKLKNYGWGSRYYDREENKVVEALSMESLKEYQGKEIRLEVENITIYNEEGKGKKIETTWPIAFTLDTSAVSERTTVSLNKEFAFENETYLIKQVEFSAFETKVVVTGTDTGPYIDDNGEKFDVMSKLENQLLNARKFEKGKGYFVDPSKSGVFLKSAGEKVEPIFNKNEIPGPLGEYAMIFAPVKNPQDTVLEVGEDIKIPLVK